MAAGDRTRIGRESRPVSGVERLTVALLDSLTHRVHILDGDVALVRRRGAGGQPGCAPEGAGGQNHLASEHIQRIVLAYQDFGDVERFAHVADLAEMKENDFNLNISRHVDTTEPVDVMSVEEALAQLREAELRRDEAVARMDELLAGMGYAR